MLNRHRDCGVRRKRQLTRQHFKQHHAYRIQAGLFIRFLSPGLLGADIMHRTDCFVRNCRHLAARKTGDAEIHHLNSAVLQKHNVLGLNVPMDDPFVVGVLQRTQDLYSKMHRFFPADNFLLVNIVF